MKVYVILKKRGYELLYLAVYPSRESAQRAVAMSPFSEHGCVIYEMEMEPDQ
jgi:hypothetical protein